MNFIGLLTDGFDSSNYAGQAFVSELMPKSSPHERARDRGICPITFHDARKFVQSHHAYLAAPRGCLFAIAAYDHADIVAVAIVNRPVSVNQDDGVTAEISRLCTHDAPRNTASALIRRVISATKAIGYYRVITYVAEPHDGACYKASMFTVTAVTSRRQWHGENACVPASIGEKVLRFELRLPGYDAAVTAVASRANRMIERRDAWANRASDSCESSSAPRLFSDR